MRILHAILSQGFYGSERYCAELASEQARNGHDVEVLIQDAWSDCAREMRKAMALANSIGAGTLGVAIIPHWAPAWLHRPFARAMLRRFKPDIVHTHLDPAARRVGGQARRLGIAHVATLHLVFNPRDYGTTDGVICIAGWQRAELPPDYAGAVAVVRNWLPSAVAAALAETSEDEVAHLRARLGFGSENFVFGSVGRLEPEKGMDRLVRAFRAA